MVSSYMLDKESEIIKLVRSDTHGNSARSEEVENEIVKNYPIFAI